MIGLALNLMITIGELNKTFRPRKVTRDGSYRESFANKIGTHGL